MKTILKKVYYCDFCGKRYFQLPAIVKHEKGCTKNPDRICGFCDIIGDGQPEMEDLLNAIVEDINCFIEKTGVTRYKHADFYDIFHFADMGDLIDWGFYDSSIPIKKLRSISNECPACILSAIRIIKSEINAWLEYEFDFKKSVQAFWNDHQEDHDHGY